MKNKYTQDTFQRQMSAVIAKLLNDIEGLQTIRLLHPFDLDKLRKRCIKATWDSYVVGFHKASAENESEGNEPVYSTECGTISS